MTNNLYNERHFTYTTTSGNEYNFYCYYQSTASGFRHLCYNYPLPVARCKGFIYQKDYISKQCWYNRTWERWVYETVLIQAIKNSTINKTDYNELIITLIDHKTIQEHHLVDQQFIDFKREYELLPEDAKTALHNSNLHLEDQEQAKALISMMRFINTLSMV